MLPHWGTARAQDGAPAAPQCAKSDFEAVVDDAAAALRDLNMKNKPDFQEKLRELKDKRGWTHDQFLERATPFVRDAKIAVFDQDSERLLSDISSQGQEGAEAKTPDCALLLGAQGAHEGAGRDADRQVDLHVPEARRGAGAVRQHPRSLPRFHR